MALEVGRVGIGAERAHRAHRGWIVFVRAAGEPRSGDLVRFEDAVEPAELGRHVRDGESRIRRELPHTLAAILDRPFHRDGVPPEQREGAQDDFLAAEAEGKLAAVFDADRLRYFDPGGAQDHGDDDVGAPEADGNGAQAAVRGSVRVGAQHDVIGPHQIPIELGVQDGLVRIVEVPDAALLREVARELHQLLRPLVVRQRDRIDGVVHRQEETVFVVQLRPPEQPVGPLHPVPGELAGDGPVDGHLQHVPRLYPGARQVAGVRRENLLRERHRVRLAAHGRC